MIFDNHDNHDDDDDGSYDGDDEWRRETRIVRDNIRWDNDQLTN